MSRIKCILAAGLLIFFLSGSKLISDEDLANESAVQYKLTVVERGEFVKEVQRSSEIYYPRKVTLRAEEGKTRLVGIYTRAERPAFEGDVLASYRIEESNAEKVRLEQARDRAEDVYLGEILELQAREAELVKAISGTADPLEKELLKLDREILTLEAEKRALGFTHEIQLLSDEIEETEARIQEHPLVSPFDGVIKSVSSHKNGDTLYSWESLVQIYTNDYFLLKVDDSTGLFRYNMPVVIEIGPRNDRKIFAGRVVAADNVLSQELRTGAAYVKFDDIGETFVKEVTFPQVDFNVIELDGVLVASKKAVSLEKGSQYVSIIEDGAVKKRMINTGLTGTDTYLILGGLSEGDELIIK